MLLKFLWHPQIANSLNFRLTEQWFVQGKIEGVDELIHSNFYTYEVVVTGLRAKTFYELKKH